MTCSPATLPEMYIPLHAHTAKGSIGDSILKIEEYVQQAKQYGLTHLALTEHGSMASMYDFYHECIKQDIMPIIGCEVYEVDDRTLRDKDESRYFHLVLIAKNEIGLKNLLYITTDAQLNGFYYKPRTDWDVLREHGEGIIALSACLGGRLPQKLMSLHGDISQEEADQALVDIRNLIQLHKEVFDEYYLEIQPGNTEEQIYVNELLVWLSDETHTPLVVTNDVHYLGEDDWHAHDIHVKIARKQKIEDPMVYIDSCYWFQNYNTIIKSFPYLDEDVVKTAVNNTVRIANQCSLDLKNIKLHMPEFGVPKGHTEESWLAKTTLQRLEEIKERVADPAAYTSRLMYELEVIAELGFAGYFLTVRDFVAYAKANNIPVGPGRGSVCGSLTAYLCGITEVDSVKYNLLFERFLSVHRKGSIPDVDLDFSADKREQMFNYAVARYGKDRCALVSTFGMRKAKASLRDTARVFEVPAEIADQAAKLIPSVYYDDNGEKETDLSIEDSLKIVPELREIAAEYPDWFEMAMKLEDLPRNASIHAAGTLVSPVQLIEYVPLLKPNNEQINATALNLSDAEKAGFVKFDFLSLATLFITDKTQQDVGFWFDYSEHDYLDEEVWNLIGSKHTTTLFQIGSKTYKDRMHRLKPKSIKELAACLALVRGPCISSKQDQVYMEIIEGTREIELIHPFYDAAVSHTRGVMLYQEQLMQVAVNFGFSLEDGYRLMKVVAKKNIDKIKEFEEKFRAKAAERNVKEAIIDRIWKIIVDAGQYLFNESHAVAYALLCYLSAYLKVHYPLEYMTNALTNAYLRKEECQETVQECRRMGIAFAPLDVNESRYEFHLEEDGRIRIGMCAIKSFGDNAAEEVMAKRPFTSMEDFLDKIEKSKCSKRAIVPAIFSGLFNCFNPDRRLVYCEFSQLRKEEPADEIKLQGGQSFNAGDAYDTIEELLLSAPLMSSPVNHFKAIGFSDLPIKKTFTVDAVIRKVKKHKGKDSKNMAFLTLETADGYIDCTVFSDLYAKQKQFCKAGIVCTVTGKKDKEDSCIAVSFA